MKFIDVHSHFSSHSEITVLQDTTQITSQLSSFGVHPVLDEKNADEKLRLTEKYASEKRIIAIGECGFDRNSALSTEQQITIFRQQAELSARYGLPVIIHCVGRWNELEQALKEKKADSPAWIIHGFRKMKLAAKFIDLGAYLSFGEALNYDETIHAAIAGLPADRVFLETDDKQFDIGTIYDKLAELRGQDVEEIAAQVGENFSRVFGEGAIKS